MTKKNVGEKLKENPWILSTLILGIVIIVFFSSSLFSIEVSAEKAGNNFVEFVNSQGGPQIEFISAKNFGPSLYEITILANGNEGMVHLTKDGNYFVQIVSPIGPKENEAESSTTDNSNSNMPKSDKPKVELFIMSHCPYGTQAEKGILPALNVLGDEIDFDLRFVYYAMHPTQGEVEEQLNEYCIQKEQEEKLFDYLTCFLQEGDREACLIETNIDQTKLDACVNSTDEEFSVLTNLEDKSSWLNGRFPLFNIDKELNDEYGIAGSPTLVINGVVAESGRDPASYLDTICQSFNEAPEVCGTELTSTAYGPGFGYDASSAGSGGSCG
jgi:hypothetical protein